MTALQFDPIYMRTLMYATFVMLMLILMTHQPPPVLMSTDGVSIVTHEGQSPASLSNYSDGEWGVVKGIIQFIGNVLGGIVANAIWMFLTGGM